MSKSSKGSILKEFPILLIVALVISVAIKTFLIQFFYIPSGSMENTLQINDRVAVNKIGNFFGEVDRGEIVVFRDTAGWLPADVSEPGESISDRFKSALVFVGILPDPAKQYLIKRVIGIGGDQVLCCDSDGKLTVNGEIIDEPYLYPGDAPSSSSFDVQVPDGFIWVMGDHRGASADSRFNTDDANKGFVPLSAVTGRAFAIVWPFKNMSYLSDYSSLQSEKKSG
jgi:signal peptidase I